MATLSLSSQLGSVIQTLEQQLNSGAIGPAGTYGEYVNWFFDYALTQTPTVLTLTSTQVRLQYPGGDGSVYRMVLQGNGIGPVSSLAALEAAIDSGLATGAITSVTVNRVVGNTLTTILQLSVNASGYTITSGQDVISVTGALPTSFEQLFELDFDPSSLSSMTPQQREAYFDQLSDYGITGISLTTNGSPVAAISLTATKLSLTVGGVTFEVNGTLPNDFGKMANAIYESDLMSMSEDGIDFSAFSGLEVTSIVIRQGATALMTMTGPFSDEASTWITGLTIDGVARVPGADGDIITADADFGLYINNMFYYSGGSVVFGSISATSGDYVVAGYADDYIYGYAGNDTLFGSFGSDLVSGGDGNDSLSGGYGNDTIDGGAGTDTLVFAEEFPIGGANNIINLARTTAQFTGHGIDVITGIEHVEAMGGNDSVTGSSARNRLDGGEGNDTLNGAAGADTLIGGSGRDLLIGGTGNDLLTGGFDADRFRFNATSGADRITDFLTFEDRLVIEGFTFANVTIADVGADTLLSFGSASVRLVGVEAMFVSQDAFIFI